MMKMTKKYGTEKLYIALLIFTLLYGLEFWNKISAKENAILVVVWYLLTVLCYLVIFHNRIIVSGSSLTLKYFNPFKANKNFPLENISYVELGLDGINLTLGKVTVYTKENEIFKISFLSSLPTMESLGELLNEHSIEVRKIGMGFR